MTAPLTIQFNNQATQAADGLHPGGGQASRGEQGPAVFEEQAGDAASDQAAIESEGTSKAQLFRARQLLREKLDR